MAESAEDKAKRPKKIITPTEPWVIPAVGEITFDKMRVKRLALRAFDPNKPASLMATLEYYRVAQEGEPAVNVLYDSGHPISIQIRDLFEDAEFDDFQLADLEELMAEATVAQQMGLALTAVQIAAESYGKATHAI